MTLTIVASQTALMKLRILSVLYAGALVFLTAVAARGQTFVDPAVPPGGEIPPLYSSGGECPPGCRLGMVGDDRPGRVVMGAEFLLIRPTFSEAIAFARGVQTPTSMSVEAVELDFDYEPAFRIHGSYRLDNGWGEAFFQYTRMAAEVEVDGGIGVNDFLVDPFGVALGAVVAPNAVLIPGADRIDTVADVELNYWDLELRRGIPLRSPDWNVEWSAGARLAELNSFYQSQVSAGGVPITSGEYDLEFFGAGPRTGMTLERRGAAWAVFASGHGSLLLGSYDVDFSAAFPGFNASQAQSTTRLIPVTELEVGARVSPFSNLNLSAGWLFHSWVDLGTSGGTFGGLFTGQDDANIMSFNGLFAGGELMY